ncbi:Ureidoglycolate lyase [Halioglobus japonicus]|nr:Ureidoglycolate lyase [Halioglobus japonicus]
MGTSVVNYSVGEATIGAWGVLRGETIYPLEKPYVDHREVMASYFSDRDGFESAIGGQAIPADTARFNSPVARNVQLFCQGLNYADHRVEAGVSAASSGENLIFMKAASSISGPNETILRPRGCELLDYEVELGLVLKQDIVAATAIQQADLPRYVGGLVLCNDVSARDLMFGSPMLQWFRGKSQRTFCPMGPVLYLMDEPDFEQLYSLQLTLSLNGEIRQCASTDLLIHRPAQTLAEISNFADMLAGDCLLTGTPGGVLVGTSLKVALAVVLNLKDDKKRRRKFTQAQLAQSRFLQPGDVLQLSISTPDGQIDLGKQCNTIADA